MRFLRSYSYRLPLKITSAPFPQFANDELWHVVWQGGLYRVCEMSRFSHPCSFCSPQKLLRIILNHQIVWSSLFQIFYPGLFLHLRHIVANVGLLSGFGKWSVLFLRFTSGVHSFSFISLIQSSVLSLAVVPFSSRSTLKLLDRPRH